jgi:hypothetical protein
MKQYTVTSRGGFKAMCENSQGRNRAVDFDQLEATEGTIPDDGVCVLGFQMLHNDVEWRSLWYVPCGGKMTEVYLDTSFESFDKHTKVFDAEDLIDKEEK